MPGDLLLITGMTNPQPQTLKTITTQLADDVTQAVVTAVTTPPLEASGTRRQIKVIMRDQDMLQVNLVETRQGLNRLATEIHEGIGLE